jgi:hypothetical protein
LFRMRMGCLGKDLRKDVYQREIDIISRISGM